MAATIQTLLSLLVVVAAVAVLAGRLKAPPAILLVVAGVVLALVPGLPNVRMAPEFVLLLVLPPIIYSSAVSMSWREFRFNLRPIALLAVGCVAFTTLAVAAATHWLLGFSWPEGFVVGAIVSPPDAVAPLSIARGLGLPRRVAVVLEGEGLANDATALILYRFAVVAVSVGTFSLGKAVGTFAAIVVGEILWGLAVGWAMLRVRRWVSDPSVEILLSILTPFAAYLPPEHLGGSGVLATVVTGLYFSWNGPRLISAATRLQGIFFWSFLTYMIEGMVFLVTGLQARGLIGQLHAYAPGELAIAAVAVSAVVIGARLTWVYPATYLPRCIPAVRRADPAPSWRTPFLIGFTGIRGIVSLAAALAIPATLANGAPFPHRDLTIFITFAVILVTLVGQGLMLPSVIGWLGLGEAVAKERAAARTEELAARKLAMQAVMDRLDRLAAKGTSPDGVLPLLRARHGARLERVEQLSGAPAAARGFAKSSDGIEFMLIEAERRLINDMHDRGDLRDEARRRIERELDLREAHLTNARAEE